MNPSKNIPAVSLVVAVHNIAPYLGACMDSLVNQTLKNIEIIAVNDYSTDNSLEILKSYAEKDPRIIIIDNEVNIKTAATRNRGIERATGEYVGFIDGDDYIDANFCEVLYNLAKETGADIAKAIKREWKNGKVIDTGNNQMIEAKGKYYFWSQVWSAIYRREGLLMKHNIRYHIDFFCLQMQAVYYANKVACTNATAYNYIRHDDSCDSPTFTLEKWIRLNLGHANYVYEWLKSHQYTDEIKAVYLNRIRFLYFYGFNRLAKNDIPKACRILADTLKKGYDCTLPTRDMKKLRRILYLMNINTTNSDFVKALILRKI